MRTDAQRIAAYISKTTPTTVGLKVAAQLAGMKTGFTAMANSLAPIEQQVQGILNGLTVPIVRYAGYYNWTREVWAAQTRGLDGPSLVDRCEVIKVKYIANGYADSTLKKIAADVFNITLS